MTAPVAPDAQRPSQGGPAPALDDARATPGARVLRRLGRGGRLALLALFAVIIVVPLLTVVFGTFKNQAELFASPVGLPRFGEDAVGAGNYATVLSGRTMVTAFRNSVIVTSIGVVLTVFFGSLAAFAIARLRSRTGNLLFAFLIIGMAVPAQVNMIPQFTMFRQLGLTNSLVGLVLINVTVTLPVAVFIMTGFMRTLPRALFEACEIDGATPWRTYRSVALPLAMPGVSATAIFLLVMHWNDLLYPLLFIREASRATIPLALLNFQGEYLTNYPLLFTGVIIASLPIVIAYVSLQRYFVAGMTAGSVKG